MASAFVAVWRRATLLAAFTGSMICTRVGEGADRRGRIVVAEDDLLPEIGARDDRRGFDQKRRPWVKVVEMLQQNWAPVDSEADASAHVFFITDASGVLTRCRSRRTISPNALSREMVRALFCEPRLAIVSSSPIRTIPPGKPSKREDLFIWPVLAVMSNP